MRTRTRTATVLVVVIGTLTIGPVAAAPAGAAAAETAAVTWSPTLADGERAGITVDEAGARLAPTGTHLAPPEPDTARAEGNPDGWPRGADAQLVPTGLLTLAPRELPAPSDEVATSIDGDLPEGSTATVDVRGRAAGGNWSEWVPVNPDGSATLPQAASEVQPRLVLAGEDAADAAVRAVTVTTHPSAAVAEGGAERVALTYRVFATREGLVGGTTANGHVIAERDHFVALPSRRALAPRGSSDYSVQVCSGGRCAFAPVWDVGPWNTRDDYWNPPAERQEWRDLPQGVPQAQAAYTDGHNGGRDQFGRRPSNPAAIDLGDGLFWDALGLKDNAWVTVDYLWTGSARLATVSEGGPVEVLAAPDAAAEVVGVAAEGAGVPAQCALDDGADGWVRIGEGQFLPAPSVGDGAALGTCEEPVEQTADPATAGAG